MMDREIAETIHAVDTNNIFYYKYDILSLFLGIKPKNSALTIALTIFVFIVT